MFEIKHTIPFLALVLLVALGIESTFAQNEQDENNLDEIGTVNEENNETNDYDIEQQTQANKTYQSQVNELTKQEFKDDIRELLDDIDTKDFKVKSNEIKTKYDEFFVTVIEQARVDSKTRNFTDGEIIEAKDYIFYETIKDEKLQALQESNSTDKLDVSFLEWIGIKSANAACPTTVHPNYKQLRLDIDGGSFNWFSYFNGGNNLYSVSYNDNSATCERTYSLYFYDEDHPSLDAAYDLMRLQVYKRTHDIEMFTIQNNNQIEFDNTWSNSRDYLCSVSYCHATTTKPYTPGQTIYVSNTWNHMMDTLDTNLTWSKVSVP